MSTYRPKPSDWIETANADNSAATATRAAPNEGLQHYVTSVSGGYDTTNSGNTLILSQGSTEIGRWNVYDVFALDFSSPIQIDPGTAVSLELAASGSAGEIGTVTLTGYTV